MHPSRVKSAASYRALGSRSAACFTHNDVEDEYNFVKAIVDAMSNQMAPVTPGGGIHPDKFVRPQSGTAGFFSTHNTMLPTVPILPLSIRSLRPASSSPQKTSNVIDIDELMNDRNNPQMLRQRKLALQAQDVEETVSLQQKLTKRANSHKTRRTVFSFQTRDMMTEKQTVVPVTPLSQSRLELTGDGKKIYDYDAKVSPRDVRNSPRPLKGILVKGSAKDGGGANVRFLSPRLAKDISLISPRLNPPPHNTPRERDPPPSPSGHFDSPRTQYRLRMQPPDRPSTSPSWRKPVPASTYQGQRARPISSNDKLSSRSAILENGSRNSLKPTSKNHSEPDKTRNQTIRSVEAEKSTTGVEGKTEMTSGTGTLTLSIFLPKEREDTRVCKRGNQSKQTLTEYESERANHTGETVTKDAEKYVSSDTDNMSLQTHWPASCTRDRNQIMNTRAESPIDKRRALHCELFGPDLCKDCQLIHELDDMRSWQKQVYPDVGTDPKRLVAAPKATSNLLTLSLPTNQPNGYGHPVHLSSPVFRNLPRRQEVNSFVTQNEIRSRIWASGSSQKSGSNRVTM